MRTGYIAVLFTVSIWGLTFVSTKVLLASLTPVEILFIRFLIGALVLFIVFPHRLKTKGWQEEKYFIAAGCTGVFLYYFLENVSLLWTTASNAGVIVSTAPFFTALFSSERKSKWFYLGFAAAIAGIAMMSVSSIEFSSESLLGDALALGAATVWGIYAVLTRKIGMFGYSGIQTVRRSFLYGLIFIAIPLLFWNNFGENRDFLSPSISLNLAFLGIAASALCFVLWSVAVSKLGAVKTSVFIYLTPVITVIASAFFLQESITLLSACGTALTLLGLLLSSSK
ncbi:MAG: DMT family transporter [Spirochaetes bacterium]|uniref:DMT family transporter n=1 Tax=Candidatus Ornithospirochaeta stercoripullorum TaxID=2840899 RepID=A0A9D9E0Q2_9SPIO|nr:DMT family transporter [Candidatus Ornithospirochaeta stercoripullorum]